MFEKYESFGVHKLRGVHDGPARARWLMQGRLQRYRGEAAQLAVDGVQQGGSDSAVSWYRGRNNA